MTPTPQQEKIKLSRWLHKKGYGCVSPYGTNETSRKAYDTLKHQQDAYEYFGPPEDALPSPGYLDGVAGPSAGYGSE